MENGHREVLFQPTKGLIDIPTSAIDAALTWHFDDKPYFFKS